MIGEGGAYATLYANRIIETAAFVGLPPGTLFGYAAAHEIGHLLLGAGSHSGRGVMRAIWEHSDFEAMRRNWLVFQAAEGERMRREANHRLASLSP
jgi:hypothetical protein